MRIITLNINGIRAGLKRGFALWLQQANPTIICLQEVKATSQQADIAIFKNQGYDVFWNAAQRPGYSGTAVFAKKNVLKAIPSHEEDTQGRCQILEAEDFLLINVYVPAGASPNADLQAKILFYNRLISTVKHWQNKGKALIIAGDLNVARMPIDAPNIPGVEHMIGFLPIERQWLEALLDCGLADSFRMINKQPYQYSWLGYQNYSAANGWRLDYILIPEQWQQKLQRAIILKQAVFSDHRPVLIELNLSTQQAG